MPIYYDMRKKYNPSNPEGDEYRARPVITTTVDLNFICDEISERASYSSGDVYGMMCEVITSIKNHIADGHRVKIDGLGSFEVKLSSKAKEKGARTTNKDVEIKGLTFRLSKTFIKNWKFVVEHCSKSMKKSDKVIPMIQRRRIMKSLLDKETVIRRKEYDSAAGISKDLAYKDILSFIEEGWLAKKGTGSNTMYFRAK